MASGHKNPRWGVSLFKDICVFKSCKSDVVNPMTYALICRSLECISQLCLEKETSRILIELGNIPDFTILRIDPLDGEIDVLD